MLQNLRNNLKGAGAVILVAIIVVPFAFFGVDTLFTTGNSANQIASVNGESIAELELQRAIQLSRQQLLNQYKNLDESLLDDEFLKNIVTDNLIAQKVLEQQARKTGMAVPLESIYPLLLEVPAYQIDGAFSGDRYEYIIRQLGYTPTTHAKAVSNEMLQQSFLEGLAISGIATKQEVGQLVSLTEQQRDYFYLTIPTSSVIDKVEVTDEEAKQFYQDNQDRYVSEEKVKVEYLTLSINGLLDQVTPDKETVDAAFQARQDEVKSAVSREVAHILIEKQQLKNNPGLIAEIQEKLANGEGFGDLAKTYSADLGSADQGGLLGSFAKGGLPEPIEVALDNLDVGGVSQPVETDAGFHLVRLLNQSSNAVTDLDALRAEVVDSLKHSLARELLIEKTEELHDIVYNAATLDYAAEQIGRPIEVSEFFTRAGSDKAPLNSLEVTKAAFSDEVLKQGYPSEVLELSEDQVLVLRVLEHQPQKVQPFDAVNQQVLATLREQKARQVLQQQADQLRERVLAGESIESIAKEKQLNWQAALDVKRNSANVDAEVQNFVFELPANKDEKVVKGFFNSEGQYVLVSQTDVQPGDISSLSNSQQKRIAYQQGVSSGMRDAKNYQQFLIEHAKIKK